MKSSLNLTPLATRRKLSRLCLFQKVYHNNHVLKSRWIQPARFISERLDHRHKIHIPHQNTVTYSHSFSPKTCREWNHLPASLACITNPNHFREALSSSNLLWIFFPEYFLVRSAFFVFCCLLFLFFFFFLVYCVLVSIRRYCVLLRRMMCAYHLLLFLLRVWFRLWLRLLHLLYQFLKHCFIFLCVQSLNFCRVLLTSFFCFYVSPSPLQCVYALRVK